MEWYTDDMAFFALANNWRLEATLDYIILNAILNILVQNIEYTCNFKQQGRFIKMEIYFKIKIKVYLLFQHNKILEKSCRITNEQRVIIENLKH